MSNIIDLQDDAIKKHWERVEKGVSVILENMQQRESWALDEREEVKNALISWAASVSENRLEEMVESIPDALVKVFAFMRSKRSLYLLHKLEEQVPGATSELLMDAIDKITDGGDDIRAQKIMRDRLVALFRVDLLERIFSEERSEKIKKAIQATSEKYGGVYG